MVSTSGDEKWRYRNNRTTFRQKRQRHNHTSAGVGTSGIHAGQVSSPGSALNARAPIGIGHTSSIAQKRQIKAKCERLDPMPDFSLTQAEADALIAMEKFCVDTTEWPYPPLGGAISIPLVSQDNREAFLLDLSRGRIDLAKGKYQTRARQIIILVRLDFGGAPHRNPDEQEVLCPHLHVYREGFGDRWAVPVPANEFTNLSDLRQTLSDFMRYCNIVQPPIFRRELFS